MGTILGTTFKIYNMASVNFFMRSKVQDKESPIYLKFRDKEIDVRVPLDNLTCKLKDWKSGKCKSSIRKMHPSDEDSINVKLSKIEENILTAYNHDKPDKDLVKDWIKNILNPSKSTSAQNEIPTDVLSFVDFYISVKESTVTLATIKKINVVKQLLIRFVEYKKNKSRSFQKLKFTDLDNSFKEDFIQYCNSEKYQLSTTFRNLKFIKMIAKVAESFNVEVNKHIAQWSFELEKATKDNPDAIYLTFADLEKIEQAEMPHDYLDNARDWLIISCYTAQRVSDFMRFKKSMIVTDSDGHQFLEFVQQKTNAKMRLPILKKVSEILEKRDGDFPRQISDVKFNLYIKKVCEIAELNEEIYNGKLQKIKNDAGEYINRKVFGNYPKYELVTSHIGRRSMASNFYEKIPTAHLLVFSGHKSERQLLQYINKTDIERAKSTAEIFSKLGY